MTEKDKATKVAIDLTAGTFGGVAQLMVGHPFDTVKVALQTNPSFTGPIDAAKQIVSKQGPQALYRGVTSPLATVAAFNAILFSSTGAVHRILRPDGGPLSTSQAALSGFIAGIPVSILATPTELLKCRLQVQTSKPPVGYKPSLADIKAGKVLFNGPRDAMAHVIKHEGGVLGLFRGLMPTLARECPGNAAYFGVYAWSKDVLAKMQGLESTDQLKSGSLMIAGGLAGPAFWVLMYPVDYLKTRVQVDSYNNPQYKGMIDCYRQVSKAEGISGLYRGFVPCIARSVPANAVTFVVYEYVKNFLVRYADK